MYPLTELARTLTLAMPLYKLVALCLLLKFQLKEIEKKMKEVKAHQMTPTGQSPKSFEDSYSERGLLFCQVYLEDDHMARTPTFWIEGS